MAHINLSGTLHQESQSKVITERFTVLEKYLGDLCNNFGKVSRKNARLRDTGDSIVSTILEYAGKERINTSSISGLRNYANYLSAVEDYRNAMIERVENKIIQPISKYEEHLKTCRSTIKSTIAVRDKEKQKQQKLNQLMQRTPNNGRNIAQAEATVESARQKVADQDRILTEKIDKFEEKKLTDIRNLLKEYTHIQILFHAKSVEMLTEAYQCLLDIDCDTDLEEFRNTFNQANLKDFRGSKMSLNTTHNSALSATGGSLPVTPNRTRSNDVQKNVRRAKSNENLKKNDYSPDSTPSNKKKNSARSKSEMELEDYTSDDSDD